MKEDPRALLVRILETPHLARLVPRLPPDVLHRVIQHCGLEDCGELVALSTPGQLAAIFDLDLWRAARPGLDEQFDADRFGLWLEVMMEGGRLSRRGNSPGSTSISRSPGSRSTYGSSIPPPAS